MVNTTVMSFNILLVLFTQTVLGGSKKKRILLDLLFVIRRSCSFLLAHQCVCSCHNARHTFSCSHTNVYVLALMHATRFAQWSAWRRGHFGRSATCRVPLYPADWVV